MLFMWISIIFLPVVLLSQTFDPFQPTALQTEEGEKQYLLLKSNTNLPQYGECWTQAIAKLDSTCTHLTETTQATLAWRFTKCFMDQSLNGEMEICDLDDKSCLESVPERIFQAYTNFYTHTQSICFYLMSQVWHSETEHTISALRTHSQSVSKQLEMAGRLQVNLLQQQREGLKVQRQLVEQGLSLSEVLHESQGRLARLTAEFKNSTIEHGRQLGDLFRRISQLHNWFVGEYAFIEQILYFIVQFLLIIILTTTKRTESSRFVLMFFTAIQIVCECTLLQVRVINSANGESHLEQYTSIWMSRKIFIGLLAVIYVTMATLYEDPYHLSIQLLKKIQQQNNELLEILRATRHGSATPVQRANGNVLTNDALNEDHVRIQNLINADRALQLSSSSLLETAQDTLDDIRNFERDVKTDLRMGVRLRPRRTTPSYN